MGKNAYYAKIAEVVKKHSGINIEEDKFYLFDSRLETLMQDYGLKTIENLSEKLLANDNPKMIAGLIEAMTTHESLFFRDIKVFDQFKSEVLPKLITDKSETKQLKVWSAACSSGQEIYSVMIQMMENANLRDFKYEVVASDISEKIIAKAKQGEYTQFEVQRGMPISYLMKYFDNVGEIWKIQENIKAPITFKQHNLIGNAASIGSDFDVVFMRNVLIYFDKSTKVMVLNNVHKSMRKGGFICVGTAENVFGCESLFEPVPNTTCWFKSI
ncbi:MAG: hypothetical protein BGO27_06615 [Alphaproteobacteria bacterium 33-17]|nr:MAG: hypothetical protein BGO27_06615 [Alphaproteobacteria bacterium 33-17]